MRLKCTKTKRLIVIELHTHYRVSMFVLFIRFQSSQNFHCPLLCILCIYYIIIDAFLLMTKYRDREKEDLISLSSAFTEFMLENGSLHFSPESCHSHNIQCLKFSLRFVVSSSCLAFSLLCVSSLKKWLDYDRKRWMGMRWVGIIIILFTRSRWYGGGKKMTFGYTLDTRSE